MALLQDIYSTASPFLSENIRLAQNLVPLALLGLSLLSQKPRAHVASEEVQLLPLLDPQLLPLVPRHHVRREESSHTVRLRRRPRVGGPARFFERAHLSKELLTIQTAVNSNLKIEPLCSTLKTLFNKGLRELHRGLPFI